ncbi:MAG: DoxX family protein [bacterium]|nr:DoxX family protein [bacterium]
MNLLSILPIFTDWPLLIARVVIAAIFLAHGWPKIKNLKQNAHNFGMMGFKPGAFWGTVVAFTEVFGGLAILVGIATPFAGFALVIDMLVATLWKLKKGMKLIGGYELDLIILATCLILAIAGPGIFSLHSYLGW